MQWKLHVRFGGRAGETHQLKSRKGAPVRPLHICSDAGWVGVRRVHHRCVLQVHSGMANRPHPPRQPRHRRVGNGPGHPPAKPPGVGPSLGQGKPKCLSVRYTTRLAESQIVSSVGSRGDSYDNALAESTIGLYKTELINQRGPWRDLDHTTFATLEYIDWYNHRCLHGGITPDNTYTTPADHETAYHQTTPRKPLPTQTTHSLRNTHTCRVFGSERV